jgi:hypothetical protein
MAALTARRAARAGMPARTAVEVVGLQVRALAVARIGARHAPQLAVAARCLASGYRASTARENQTFVDCPRAAGARIHACLIRVACQPGLQCARIVILDTVWVRGCGVNDVRSRIIRGCIVRRPVSRGGVGRHRGRVGRHRGRVGRRIMRGRRRSARKHEGGAWDEDSDDRGKVSHGSGVLPPVVWAFSAT